MKRKKGARLGESEAKVTLVTQIAHNGMRIGKATRVTLASGCKVTFLGRVPKRQAIKQAQDICRNRAKP